MPNCRNCGARISKFDKDICPVCGTKDPLNGVSSDTAEVTAQVDLSNFKEGQKVLRRRKSLLFLFVSCGFTGAGYFYLKKLTMGLIWLLLNLAILPALFCLFHYWLSLDIFFAISLPILIVYFINAAVGFYFYLVRNLKDGEGEFVN